MHADNLNSPFVAMRKSDVEFKGIYTRQCICTCDLDLQSMKAKRPYFTDKLAAKTCMSVYLLPYCTCAKSFSSLVFKFQLYRPSLSKI